MSAIAITLLVLDIGTNVDSNHVDSTLYTLVKPTVSYLVTFFIIAIYWRFHRNLMQVVQRLDRGFLLLTFLFLAFIAFFPVTSRLLGNYAEHIPVVIIYTSGLSGCGFSAFALWSYATRKHRLVSPDLSQAEINTRTFTLLLTPLIYSASLLLLFVVPGNMPYLICFSWVLIGLVERCVRMVYNRWLEKPAQHISQDRQFEHTHQSARALATPEHEQASNRQEIAQSAEREHPEPLRVEQRNVEEG